MKQSPAAEAKGNGRVYSSAANRFSELVELCVLAGALCFPCSWEAAIVLVHWLLTVWACMDYAALPDSYQWGNFTVLTVGVWAIAQRDSIDAIIMFLIGLLLTILTDIIHLSIYYPRGHNLTDLQRFTAGMAIFSLLLKPLSCFFVYQMYRERGGEYAFNLGFPTVSRDRSAYQSIDQQDVPCPYPDLDSKPAPRPF